MPWFRKENSLPEKVAKIDDAARKVRTEGLWVKCEGCRQIIWKKDLEANWNVCPKCGLHSRLDAAARLKMLLDDGDYEAFEPDLRSTDPLGFVDSKPYPARLRAMEQATNLAE